MIADVRDVHLEDHTTKQLRRLFSVSLNAPPVVDAPQVGPFSRD
jgi:hypothetical protein